MKKIKQIKEYYDYHEIVELIQNKYNVNIHDVKGWSAVMHYQCKRAEKAMNKKFGNTHKKRCAEWKNDDPRWKEISTHTILREGELHFETVGYCNYWHFLLECFEVHNGCIVNINWEDIRDIALEDDGGEPGWRTQITDLFIQEIGSDDNDYLIEW